MGNMVRYSYRVNESIETKRNYIPNKHEIRHLYILVVRVEMYEGKNLRLR